MKKFKKIFIGVLLLGIVTLISVIIWYNYSLSAVSREKNSISFTVNQGTGKEQIIENLYSAGIIRNALALKIYMFLTPNDIMAGSYLLDNSLSAKEIVKSMTDGVFLENTVKITFVEGKRVTEYAKIISENFPYTSDEVLEVVNNAEFLKTLRLKYEIFTEDAINEDIYYKLEGYLYPDTYEFYNDASIEEILEKMVSTTNEKYKDLFSNYASDEYSVHDIFTIASIAEIEANSKNDRIDVAQVIYSRIDTNMTLGMDVTSYYGARLEMSEEITYNNGLSDSNPYNTRAVGFYGLPVGSICNPSMESIEAALNPGEHNYLYFFADDKGVVHFFNNLSDFNAFKHS